jgi:beta-glucanase (GH16 family)
MSAKFGRQEYGRWETRMRTGPRVPQYHPVLILWPNVRARTCPEIDYAEGSSPDTTKLSFFLHYGCNHIQTYAIKPVDTTQWHNYAVEWTPSGVVGYIDGVAWFRDNNVSHLPPGSMHETIQLDWFPNGSATRTAWMQVDWTRVYKYP